MAKHVAIISGGAGDIGRAIALELARYGADIAVGDLEIEGEKIDALRLAIELLGRRIRFDIVDVTNPTAVEKWLLLVEQSLGVPDWIIPNAAVAERADLESLTADVWKRCLDVTLNGAYYLAAAGANRLLQHKMPGRIVFIGSWAAHAPHTNVPAYSVAKAGVRMLVRVMALHYARHGILVNEVAPGYVDAGLSKVGFDKDPRVRQRCEAQVPVGQLMSAEDVAFHVAHLCDDRNRFMTGSTLLADGGLSLLARMGATNDNRRTDQDLS
ncbi:MAG TPA: SDR family oxidoreductase [Lacipirellulaceae bacterium]|nr:SDR family oxidoreductase [Lacipirellulaceae bacterium]